MHTVSRIALIPLSPNPTPPTWRGRAGQSSRTPCAAASAARLSSVRGGGGERGERGKLRVATGMCECVMCVNMIVPIMSVSRGPPRSSLRYTSLASLRAKMQILQEAGWPVCRRAHADAGGPNMKVDRIGTLSNSYVCTRCLCVRHIANSRRRQTSLRASERLPRWVGVCRKCMETSIGSSRNMYLLPGSPSLHAIEACGEARAMCKVHDHSACTPCHPPLHSVYPPGSRQLTSCPHQEGSCTRRSRLTTNGTTDANGAANMRANTPSMP